MLYLLLLLLQNQEADYYIKTYGLPVFLLIVTNGIQFWINRQTISANVAKITSETMANMIKNVQASQEIQKGLDAQAASAIVEKNEWRDKWRKVNDKLQDCVDNNAPCEDCHNVIKEATEVIDLGLLALDLNQDVAEHINNLRIVNRKMINQLKNYKRVEEISTSTE